MKSKFYFGLLLSVLTISFGFSQEDTKEGSEKRDVYMTWNKDTPEKEMNDDIKALSEYGVTISYSNVKRNSQNEITSLRVEYSDKNGNKGSMEVDNKKPINTIRFFKQGDSVGFGDPGNSDFLAGNFNGGDNFMKQFNFGNGNAKSFNFSFPDNGTFGKSNSKIIIEHDGRKPLVIEDGKVIEGGDDYTPDELEKIKKDNKFEFFGGDMSKFNFDSENGSLGNLNEQMQKMQEQLDQLMNKSDNIKPGSEDEKTIKELKKAKEEMLKAKEEMEKTTKELKKAKSSLKTQKA